jgi:Outer membrane protein beta-barrel domain
MQKLKSITIYIILLLNLQSITAQTLTPYIGVNFSRFHYRFAENQAEPPQVEQYLKWGRFSAYGLGVEFGNGNWRFHPQLGYNTRGSKEYRGNQSNVYDMKAWAHFIDLAMPIRWYRNEEKRAKSIFLDIGGQIGQARNSDLSGVGSLQYLSRIYEALALVGIGYKIPLTLGNLQFGLRYEHGLTSLTSKKLPPFYVEGYLAKYYHRVVSFRVAYGIQLKQ